MTLAAALAVGMAAALASPTAFAEKQHNWMREYVELRLHAKLERAAGREVAARMPRIVGGAVAGPNSNPFQVGILFKAEPDNFFAQYCGGTLFRANIVITAAHCSDFVTASDVQVLTGARSLDGTGVRRNVVRIDIHPAWDPVSFDSDVAVWRLATPAPNPRPFPTLAPIDPAVGTPLLATGWGNTETTGFPIDLMEVKLPLVARGNCNDADSYDGDITARMLCAGFDAGGKDTCQGDSGGPLTNDRRGDGIALFSELTGITSWGIGCAEPNLFGVYTRVSNPSIRNFILNRSGP
jgi:secreted trypsin-like serine protease